MKRLLILILTSVFLAVMAACSLNAIPPKIMLDGAEIQTLSMFEGQELLLSTDSTVNVSWQSSDEAVVKVEADGYLRARREGTANVTLTAGSKFASLEITVTPYIAVEEVRPVSDTIVIKAGGEKKLNPTVLPENASDPALTYEIIPSDGMLSVTDGAETCLSGAPCIRTLPARTTTTRRRCADG